MRRSDDESIAVGSFRQCSDSGGHEQPSARATEMRWSPISSTLISGDRDAVLVDTAITVDQNQKLVDWIPPVLIEHLDRPWFECRGSPELSILF